VFRPRRLGLIGASVPLYLATNFGRVDRNDTDAALLAGGVLLNVAAAAALGIGAWLTTNGAGRIVESKAPVTAVHIEPFLRTDGRVSVAGVVARF
jgi:hypothetical protein